MEESVQLKENVVAMMLKKSMVNAVEWSWKMRTVRCQKTGDN